MSTVTIEAIDLADYDWTPRCEVRLSSPDPKGYGAWVLSDPCGEPAAFVIEVRHCSPYRLFACAECTHGKAPGGWSCRVCDQSCDAPLVIGKAS